MTSWEYASCMNAGPSRGGARRPEKRVTARSKPPQKKCAGLHLPTKGQRRARVRLGDLPQDPPEPPDLNGVVRTVHRVVGDRIPGDGSSTGTGQILTPRPMSESAAIVAP